MAGYPHHASVPSSPVSPPLAPMLGRRIDALPLGDWIYEPKWDGFRCLAFRSGDDLDLRSRHDRPLARYFPELVAALRELPDAEVVLDGEIVVPAAGGLDFEGLLARVHPAASRVERLRGRPRRASSPSTCSPAAARTCASDPSASGASCCANWWASRGPRCG
jgi:ATP-dependent DNA ligase